MTLPLMPKATAVWLVENTTLTFEQIAEFCGLHTLEVKGIADGDVAASVMGVDPVVAGQLPREEIDLCEADPHRRLQISAVAKKHIDTAARKQKGGKYTPVARRQDKPDAIAWFVKLYPEVSDAQIAKLVGTTKNTINAVRGKTHWNSSNIKPRDPVLLGLCKQSELDPVIAKSKEIAARKQSEAEENQQKSAQ